MNKPQRIKSALKLARAAANTKSVLRRWTDQWAEPHTKEHREAESVLHKIAELDEAITAMCAAYDTAQSEQVAR